MLVKIGMVNRLVTASKKDGSGQTHLLVIQFSDGFYMSHERNIYDDGIALCGLETFEVWTSSSCGYIKGGMNTTITCKKCLRIINKEGHIFEAKEGEMKGPGEKGITLREFVESITKETEESGWGMDKEVSFNTSGRSDLYYLSIYENGGKICIDIGEDDE